MKISPITPGTSQAANATEGISVSPDRMARAKAVAAGQELPQTTGDAQVDKVQNTLKKIKMKTNVSQNRHLKLEEPETVAEVPQAESDKTVNNEQTEVVSEDTKPLGPQFAALARQKREIQVAQKALEAQKAALANQPVDNKSLEDYRARIKANALSVLQEEGVTYDQLTEQILADNSGGAELAQLKAEMKALKEGFDAQNKSLTDKEASTERQVLSQIQKEANQLVAQGDDFEMIREAGYASKVTELIHKTWKTTGELLETNEAAALVENELLEESLKFAKIKKVQSKLNPAQPQKQQPVKQDGTNTKVMRTLTNRDGSSSLNLSKRERAIAAMEGRLK